jgi:hypothetical protein
MAALSECLSDERVFAWLADQLSPPDRQLISEHLKACEDCAALLTHAQPAAGDSNVVLAHALQRRPMLPTDLVIADRYRMVRFIGRGGMGEVYEVEDLELGSHLALKTLGEQLARDPRMVSRLKREGQLARKVTHANVCRIFDIGYDRRADDGSIPLIFITMELLAGETLRERLSRNGPMSSAAALPIVRQLAEGLAAAHASGVIHRDFKSDNVMLLSDGDGARAVVTDFGLARAAVENDVGLSSSGRLIGTAAYMAPEQAMCEPATTAVDIYALGVVMFEMVTGRLPFNGSSPMATALERLRRPAPSARMYVPDLDPTWDAVIGKCLERAPAQRFATAAEVAQALVAGASTGRQGRPVGHRSSRLTAAAIGATVVGLAAFGVGRAGSSKRHAGNERPTRATAAAPAEAIKALARIATSPAAPLTSLVIRADVTAARVTVDGRALSILDGRARVDVTAAEPHVVVVTAPGHRRFRQAVVVTGGVRELVVRLRPLAPAQAPPDDNVFDPYQKAT